MRETKEDRTLRSHQPQGKGRKDSFIGKSGKQDLNKIQTSFSVNLLNAGMSFGGKRPCFSFQESDHCIGHGSSSLQAGWDGLGKSLRSYF